MLTAIAATSNLLMVLPSLHGHGFSHRLQHTILTRFIDPSSLGRWLWLSQVKSVPAKFNLARAHALAHPFYDRATQRFSRGLFADLYPGIHARWPRWIEPIIFWECDDMRVLMVTLTAMTLLLVTGRAEAEKLGGEGEPKGDEFLRQKKPKVAKDYYVVPTGQSHQCSSWRVGEKACGCARRFPICKCRLCEGSAQNISRMQGWGAGRGDGQKTSEKMKPPLARLVRAIGGVIGGFGLSVSSVGASGLTAFH